MLGFLGVFATKFLSDNLNCCSKKQETEKLPQKQFKILLGYWNRQGLAQNIRYLMNYLNIEYEEKIYNQKDEWFEDKQKLLLETDFPNLPYIRDLETGQLVTESHAIVQYICYKAKREDLLGKTVEQKIEIEQLKSVTGDVLTAMVGLAYNTNQNFEEVREQYFKDKVFPKIDFVYKHLGNKQFLCENLTYMDFRFVVILNVAKVLLPWFLDNYPKFQEYIQNIYSIPQIQAFLESDRNPKRIFSPPGLTQGVIDI